MKPSLSLLPLLAAFLASPPAVADSSLPLPDGTPLIAGPTEFRVELVAESTVELSWSDILLGGSEAALYRLYDGNRVIATPVGNRWRIDGISRDAMYYFSVSAVTTSGEETRRSVPVHIDLPPLAGDTDGGNRQLPPLRNVYAEIVDETTAVIRWDPAEPFWSPTESGTYRYMTWIGNSGVAEIEETSWTYDGFDPDSPTWVGISARSPENNGSGNHVFVLVDTGAPPGTRIDGYPGSSAVERLSAEVYSGTAALLFWDGRGAGPAYNVVLDGRLVARVGDYARSLFLDGLTPGTRTKVSIGSGWPYEDDDGRDGLLRHVWIETPPVWSGNLGNPTAVTGLRAEVYSASAAEVFWDRSDAVLATYQVSIDGGPAEVTDGVSRFIDGLASDTEVAVAVTAVGPDGTKTASAEVRFRTLSAWVDPGPPACTVSNLRVALYSSTAVELFWDRDPAGPTYAITLDGEPLIRTQGTGWFGDRFEAGSEHVMGVAVDDATCEDAETTVSFRLPGR